MYLSNSIYIWLLATYLLWLLQSGVQPDKNREQRFGEKFESRGDTSLAHPTDQAHPAPQIKN